MKGLIFPSYLIFGGVQVQSAKFSEMTIVFLVSYISRILGPRTKHTSSFISVMKNIVSETYFCKLILGYSPDQMCPSA